MSHYILHDIPPLFDTIITFYLNSQHSYMNEGMIELLDLPYISGSE